MLTRDDWRTLSALFWNFQECVLGRDSDIRLRAELATWLRDHDMPLLEIDRRAQRELPEGTLLGTPGHLLCHGICYHACRFGFDAATGELAGGVLVWELVSAYRDGGGDWRPVPGSGHGASRLPAALELHGLREAGEYRLVVVRGLGHKGD